MTKEQFQNAVWGMYGCQTIDLAWELYKQSQHALWMARAYNGFNTTYNTTSYHNYMIEHPDTKITQRRWYHCWGMVERKCLDKAKEFE